MKFRVTVTTATVYDVEAANDMEAIRATTEYQRWGCAEGVEYRGEGPTAIEVHAQDKET
jgi:hypothetical protein